MRSRRWAAIAACASFGAIAFACFDPSASADDGDRRVKIRVLGPDGQSPDKVWIRVGSGEAFRAYEALLGAASWTVSAKDVELFVYLPRDADGEPLPWAPRRLTVPAGESRVDVRLEKGFDVVGRVVDSDGAAVAGAYVSAQFASAQGPPGDDFLPSVAETATDENGSFRLQALGSERYVIRTTRFKRDVVGRFVRARGGDTGVTLRLQKPQATLTLIDWKGKPVADAHVYIVWFHGSQIGQSFDGTSDAHGTVSVDGLDPTSQFALTVEPSDDRDDLAEVDSVEWRPSDTKIRMARGYAIRGVVRDPRGALIRAQVLRRRPFSPKWESSFCTNDDGTFVIRRVPYGETELLARPPGDNDDEGAVWTTVSPDRPSVELRLDLDQLERDRVARTVRIRVLDPEGLPVPRAWLIRSDETKAGAHAVIDGRAVLPRRAVRDRVRVSSAMGVDGQALPFAPASREVGVDERHVEIRLVPGMTIDGHVRQEDGAPLVGVRVRAEPVEPGEFGADGEALSDVDGAFRIVGLGRQPYSLVVAKLPRPFIAYSRIRADGGATGVEIAVRIGSRSSIKIVDWDGKPVDGASLVRYAVRDDGPGPSIVSELFRATSDVVGSVDVGPFDPDRPLYLTVEPPKERDDLCPFGRESAPARWDPKAGTLVLDRAFVATGVTRDGYGRVVMGAIWREISTSHGDEWVTERTGLSDLDGTFRVRGLPYGPVRLWAVPIRPPIEPGATPGRNSGALNPDDLKTVTPDDPHVELRLAGAPRSLRLKLRGIEEGRQGWIRRDGFDVDEPSVPIVFGREGVAEVEGVAPGLYTVWVPPVDAKDTSLSYREFVELGPFVATLIRGEFVPVQIQVKLPADSTLTRLEIVGPLGKRSAAVKMKPGEYVVRGLPAGPWTVEAVANTPLGDVTATATTDAKGRAEVTFEPK